MQITLTWITLTWICLKCFVQGCLSKHIFISNLTQIPWNCHFPYMLVFQKINLIFKLISRASELPQRPKFDILQEALFCTLQGQVLKEFSIDTGYYLCIAFTFSTKNYQVLKILCILKEVKTNRKMFRSSWKNIRRFFHISTQFPFTTSERELDFYHQNVNRRVASRVTERLKT